MYTNRSHHLAQSDLMVTSSLFTNKSIIYIETDV